MTKKRGTKKSARVTKRVRLVGEDARWLMFEDASWRFGSCENAARWEVLEDTIRWCAFTLGVYRVRRIAMQPARWHRRWLERVCTHRVSRSQRNAPAEFNTLAAVGALRLCCLSVSRGFIFHAVNRGVYPGGAHPPWLSASERRLSHAAAVDQALAERDHHA